MYKPATAAILIAFLPSAFAHIAFWHPSVYGFHLDGYKNVEPLSGKDFNSWWFHGRLHNPPPKGDRFNLPAGGTVTLELACNKDFTSYGSKKGGNNPCPPDTPSMHAGNPIKDDKLLGCGIAIAYKEKATDVKRDDFVIISVNTECVKVLNTQFQIPAGLPPCPNNKCVCGWFWQGQESANEMYMNGFDCTVTNPGNKKIGKPKVPVWCDKDPNKCVKGPKQAMYWANSEANVHFSGNYNQKPSYTPKWGFMNGAQNDIFEGGSKRKRQLNHRALRTVVEIEEEEEN